MNLNSFKKNEVDSTNFNFAALTKKYQEKTSEMEKLLAPKKEVVEKKVEVKAVLVELTTEELKRGHGLYKKCIVCHGKAGAGKKSQNSPRIGGQFAWYIETQVNNMISGVRVNKVMQPYIKKLSPQDVKDLATYISALPWQ